MNPSAMAAEPSPELFFNTLNAHQQSAALKAAIDLDLFTVIGEGAETVAAAAERCRSSERGVRILCDYLVVTGFLTKAAGRYGLTDSSRIFLDRRSPAYVGIAVEFLLSPSMMEAFKDLAAVVQKGGTLLGEESVVAPEHPVWVRFARAMAPLMRSPAEMLAKLLEAESGAKATVLDIAAGHGLYGIAIAKANPNAQIVAVDWPNVLTVAEENARAAGVSDRFQKLAGNAFEVEYGSGFDLALIPNFLHHFDTQTCEKFLRKVHAALKPGGRAAILEFIPNEDRVSPSETARFSLIMLATTPGGDAYTFSEHERMLKSAGFSRNELHSLPKSFFSAIIAYK